MSSKIENWFWNISKKHLIHKLDHYLKIYEKSFNKFIDKNPVILEIGIFKGGSIEMWNYYFDNKCTIYAIDINPDVLKLQQDFGENVKIIIGDQGDPTFWDNFLSSGINFDMIIDDGSHQMKHQILTYEKTFDYLKDEGVYMCEDCCTSYWKRFDSYLNNPNSFIEYTKKFIDYMYFYHIDNPPFNENFRKNVFCITYYDSIVVIDKKENQSQHKSIKMT